MHTLKTDYKCLFVCLLFISASFTSSSQSGNPISDELIIKWKPDISKSKRNSYTNLLPLQSRKLKDIKGTNIEVWKLPLANKKEIHTLIEQYKDHPAISLIEPNYIYKSFDVIPNDPLFNQQWGLKNEKVPNADIAAPDAWEIHKQSPSVKVAIIDSGIDWTHPDLIQNIWQNLEEDIDKDGTVLEWTGAKWIFDPGDENGIDDDGNGYIDDFIGWDFRDNDNNPFDLDGHGTHIAGIVGAEGNNGLGVAGVTWEVQLVPLRIIGNGHLKISDAIEAIQYATQMNIPISNNSWGGETFSLALFQAIQEAATKDHLCITATGNEGLDIDAHPIFPASFSLDNILNVAASDTLDRNAHFKIGSSNFGANSVDIYAPGLDILSCLPDGAYGQRSGTSMAAPHVVGACALVKNLFPNMPYQELKAYILNSASPISSLTNKCVSGGRLNLFNTLSEGGLNCAYRDSIGLVALYHSTNGANWNITWNLSTPIGTWNGVTTNSNGCVIAIDLTANNLVGTIPSSIQYFSALTSLKLSNNQLQGNITGAIGQLEALTHLELNDNQLSGNLPTSIGQLFQLEYLDLSNNFLSEDIPDMFENIIKLNIVYLDRNQLTGLLPPSLIFRPFLDELFLNNNNLSGSLTYLFSLGISQVKKLHLNNNQFSGFIPIHLELLPDLEEINLSNNQFSGCYQSNLSSLCDIIVDFSNNPDLPEEGDFSKFCMTRTGECTDCSLSDSLALIDLYNATNGPNWTITWDLSQPINTWHGIYFYKGCVSTISLNENNLVGIIPPSLFHLRYLRNLLLAGNQLTGSIPKELGFINALDVMALNNNNLTGSIPRELWQLRNLNFLYLQNNLLSGAIPEWDDFSSNITILELNNNQLSGSIPASINKLVNLIWLRLDFNNLTGNIPAEIGQLNNLHTLNLNNNLIDGSIPSAIGGLKKITILSIKNNSISGSIPKEISNLSTLQGIDLSFNNLTGAIPPEFGLLNGLISLNLRFNQLTGNIPIQLTTITSLKSLVLDWNQLSGPIPHTIGNLTQLSTCNLANNNLSGCFPESLLRLCDANVFFASNPNLPNQGNFISFCNNQNGMCVAPVYPGDFNNDGIASKEDVLYWGLAESAIGVPRPNAKIEWYGQECPDWETAVLDIDNKHQDGDGNGIVNELDLEVLKNNYGKTHGYHPFNEITNGTTYELATTHIRNDTIQIVLSLDTKTPTNMHGIAASIDFGDFGVDSILMDFSNAALNPSHHLAIYDEVNNVLDIALTRTNKQDTICEGVMGSLIIIAADAIDLDDDILIAAKNGSMVQANGNLNAIGDATMFSTYSLPPSSTNLVSSISVSPVACNQLGAAAVTINGGTPPYSYQWNTGATTKELTGLTEGIYSLTITDMEGLTKDYSIEIEGQYIPVYDENGELVDCSTKGIEPEETVSSNNIPNALKQPNIFINPNPAYQNTIIEYELPFAMELHLTITDLHGRFVQSLQKERFARAGYHQFAFDGSQLPGGIYLVHLQTNQSLITRKLLLLK